MIVLLFIVFVPFLSFIGQVSNLYAKLQLPQDAR